MTMGAVLEKFDQFQTFLENKYAGLLRVTLRHPLLAILFAVIMLRMVVLSSKPKAAAVASIALAYQDCFFIESGESANSKFAF